MRKKDSSAGGNPTISNVLLLIHRIYFIDLFLKISKEKI